MIGGGGVAADVLEQRYIRGDSRFRQESLGDVGLHGPALEYLNDHSQAPDERVPIELAVEIVGPDGRSLVGIGAGDVNRTHGLRPALVDHRGHGRHRHGTNAPFLVVKGGAGSEMNLHVGCIKAVARVPETAHRGRSGGQWSAAQHQPFQACHADPPALHLAVDRLLRKGSIHGLGEQMILQILPNLRQVMDELYAELAQPLPVPDPGQLQELRRVDGAAGQDHFPGGDPRCG